MRRLRWARRGANSPSRFRVSCKELRAPRGARHLPTWGTASDRCFMIFMVKGMSRVPWPRTTKWPKWPREVHSLPYVARPEHIAPNHHREGGWLHPSPGLFRKTLGSGYLDMLIIVISLSCNIICMKSNTWDLDYHLWSKKNKLGPGISLPLCFMFEGPLNP